MEPTAIKLWGAMQNIPAMSADKQAEMCLLGVGGGFCYSPINVCR